MAPFLGLCMSNRSFKCFTHTEAPILTTSLRPDPHFTAEETEAGADKREYVEKWGSNLGLLNPETRLQPGASLDCDVPKQPRLGTISEGGDFAGAHGQGEFKREDGDG